MTAIANKPFKRGATTGDLVAILPDGCDNPNDKHVIIARIVSMEERGLKRPMVKRSGIKVAVNPANIMVLLDVKKDERVNPGYKAGGKSYFLQKRDAERKALGIKRYSRSW